MYICIYMYTYIHVCKHMHKFSIHTKSCQISCRNFWTMDLNACVVNVDFKMFAVLNYGFDTMCFAACKYYVTMLQCCSVLQCIAVYCSVLQCVAMCCSVLQCCNVAVAPSYLLSDWPCCTRRWFLESKSTLQKSMISSWCCFKSTTVVCCSVSEFVAGVSQYVAVG